MATYEIGERVLINFDIDSYKIGDEIIPGTLEDIKISEKRKQLFGISRLMIIAKDLNGKEYALIRGTYRDTNSTSFINLSMFVMLIKVKKQELTREIAILTNLENIYLDEIAFRTANGLASNTIKDKYTKFMNENSFDIKERLETLDYLERLIMPYLSGDTDKLEIIEEDIINLDEDDKE